MDSWPSRTLLVPKAPVEAKSLIAALMALFCRVGKSHSPLANEMEHGVSLHSVQPRWDLSIRSVAHSFQLSPMPASSRQVLISHQDLLWLTNVTAAIGFMVTKRFSVEPMARGHQSRLVPIASTAQLCQLLKMAALANEPSMDYKLAMGIAFGFLVCPALDFKILTAITVNVVRMEPGQWCQCVFQQDPVAGQLHKSPMVWQFIETTTVWFMLSSVLPDLQWKALKWCDAKKMELGVVCQHAPKANRVVVRCLKLPMLECHRPVSTIHHAQAISSTTNATTALFWIVSTTWSFACLVVDGVRHQFVSTWSHLVAQPH